ncbi:hypothetical protein O181_003587 [Austropuccinia psidii MF-1]|uniref:Retrotransposon gag domain-containing protein n=1 Tax=Austropuccinia psidii MF-1 TaxID=1389203 RepID=A0A9Q3GF13_9BASI|nr:hypothetical protein [Austropuccinia psidii MF-1]
MEGAAPSGREGVKSIRSRSFSGLLGGYLGMSEGERAIVGEAEDEEGEESVEEEDSGETDVADALENAPEVPQGSHLALSSQPLVSQTEPILLNMMEQMTQFMGKLTQAVSPRENSKAPDFKTPPMKAPVLLMIEPYLSNISNEDTSYLLNNWQLFETKLLTLFGDPNKVRKAEQKLDNLRIKESDHVSMYIADFRSLMSRIEDCGERAYIHVYRRGLASRLLDQLLSHPRTFETLQELMDVTLELDTRYHERQKEKGGNQEKKPPAIGSNQSRDPQNSCSKRPHQKKNKKGKQFQYSKDKPHATLLHKENKLIGSEKERRVKQGLCTYCGGKHPIEKFFKRP